MRLISETVYKKVMKSIADVFSNLAISGRIIIITLAVQMTLSCAQDTALRHPPFEGAQSDVSPANADDLLIVDCLLPGRIMRLGTQATFVGPRRPLKTTGVDCAIRGGEYTAYDRANYETARKIWLSKAQEGDKEAQNYMGEIYEKGLGLKPDYAVAAKWYQLSAEQGHAPAQINFGKLYETGLGVPKDMQKALYWYRRASGLQELQPLPELKPIAETKEKAGPVIQIIEPPVLVTRGVAIISAQKDTGSRLLAGKVTAPNGLLTLTINGNETATDKSGLFKTNITAAESEAEIIIAAIDKRGLRTDLRIKIKSEDPPHKQLDFGRYHALVIGNNNYQHLNKLVTARPDAKTVSEVLEKRYGFNVTLLYDATRYQILNSLNKLRKTLTEDDNLLIYYAGHGELDKVNDQGNWLPVDAERESSANWLSNISLTEVLNTMSARHILVIADSCFSGTLTRSVLTQLRPGHTDEARTVYLKTVLKKRSRTALTSGGLAPVLDDGSKGHSVFANLFIDVLKANADVLEGQRLFLEIADRVTYEASKRKFEQLPQYAPIKFSGHEAGDFFLVPEI